jgi:hypothetical protein
MDTISQFIYFSWPIAAVTLAIYFAYIVWVGKIKRRYQNKWVIGAFTGGAVATSYICTWSALVSNEIRINRSFTNLQEAFVAYLFVIISFILMSTIPGVILGAATGWTFQMMSTRRSTRVGALVLILMICGTFTLLIHSAVFLSLPLITSGYEVPIFLHQQYYIYLLGIPTLLYFTASIRTVLVNTPSSPSIN